MDQQDHGLELLKVNLEQKKFEAQNNEILTPIEEAKQLTKYRGSPKNVVIMNRSSVEQTVRQSWKREKIFRQQERFERIFLVLSEESADRRRQRRISLKNQTQLKDTRPKSKLHQRKNKKKRTTSSTKRWTIKNRDTKESKKHYKK